MANWKQFSKFVRDNYKIAKEEDGKSIIMAFGLPDGRSQIVFIWRQALMNGKEEWVQIESPIGELNPQNAAAVIKAAEHTVVGGIGCSGDLLTVRHAFPLENFDKNEFERPVILVTSTADNFEKMVFGGDKF